SYVIEQTVLDGDVLEAAIGFGSKLDTARGTESPVLISKGALISSVEQRAFIVTAHLTVVDSYIFSGPCVTERKRTLRTDPVVEWRVNRAVRDTDILTSVNINTIAVRVYLYVVDG